MAAVTFPLLTVVDDAGRVVTGATVAITSVKDREGADVPSPGATLHQSGANVSVEYDPEAKGEAWVVLGVSKAGSTFTGLNAAPAFFLARDSSRLDAAVSSRQATFTESTGVTLPPDPADASDIVTAFAAVPEAVWGNGTRTLTASLGPTAGAIAAAVLAAGDVDGFTLEETLKLCLAVLAAKVSGSGTGEVVFRAADDSKARVTVTLDLAGNRTNVTLDAGG